MRSGRAITAALVALALAPGTWLRSDVPPKNDTAPIYVNALSVAQKTVGPFRIEGVWELVSDNDYAGGYSALTFLGEGQLLAGSDTGYRLAFRTPVPGEDSVIPAEAVGTLGGSNMLDKRDVDLEALTRDPRTGTIWSAFERTNSIQRYDSQMRPTGRVVPPAMIGWEANSGPETMARLPDGRSLVIAEGTNGWLSNSHDALLYMGDPVEGADAIRFTLASPYGYRPVDAAMLDERRVLILLRNFDPALPPDFTSAIAVGDVTEIAEGEEWSVEVIAQIEPPLPSDNLEGMAVAPGSDGVSEVWLIADDNFGAFQRTLLYKLSLPADF
ncbi:esterase-like activity of phytase family protein [Qipengyuania atrilutea]|uniref:Esterase-like activity of phytase family protein n=1 Tax=Qipengyuania atrilutea TaxID=2744473 RepID=A0A850H5U7_9SPHN|nr:esterase-like activity of phytase family protein [Actirhodobacter atriluteus]NVD44515.1 esterase-like activity of phytase family protein [Actirhodobacter atriluteus]